MTPLAAVTYIASPTGAGGFTLQDRLDRIDGLSEDVAKDILKRCVSMAADAKAEAPCHCGEPVAYGYDGDPTHQRGMCAYCDSVRCDAYPGACRPLRLGAAVDGFHP